MRIYFDDVVRNKISSIDGVVNSNNAFCSVDKKKINGLSMFFDCITLDCDNNDNVNLIEFDDVKVKSKDNIIDVNDEQKFDIRKSYVASIDKRILNGVINFYDLIKTSVLGSGKIVFDASKETRLQNAMHTIFINPNENATNATSNVEPSDTSKNVVEPAVQDASVKEEEHKKGHINIFWICIVASLFLTIFTVLRVMGISIF